MNRSFHFLIVAVLFAVAGCGQGDGPDDATQLRVLCGSSMTEPMKVLVDRFEQKTGVPVELTLGGSETLLPQVELGVPADVFIGHDPFDDLLAEKGLRQKRLVSLGAIRPSVVVQKGDPKNINELADLARSDVRVGLPDSRFSTCGEMFEEAAAEIGLLEGIHARTVHSTRTHQELATALRTGGVDVVVVWNFIAAMHKEEFEIVSVETEFPSVGVFATAIAYTTRPDTTKELLDFLDTDASRTVFREMGYGDVRLDAKESGPAKMLLYCAAGVQKPVDGLVERFRTQYPNVEFEVVYQGSGTLLTQIELAEKGDLYVAGDESYMDLADEKGLLAAFTRMAVFTPVLVTPADNPKHVTTFQDLVKPGIKLGLGDEKAAAVGKVAVSLLERKGVWPAAQQNVVVTAGTVNQLATQVAVGNLDAAVIWDATANQFRDRVNVVARGDESTQVGVPVGVLKFTGHRSVADKFVEFTTSSEAASVLRRHGFEPATSSERF